MTGNQDTGITVIGRNEGVCELDAAWIDRAQDEFALGQLRFWRNQWTGNCSELIEYRGPEASDSAASRGGRS